MSGEITLEHYKTWNNGNVAECLISYDEQGILLEKKLEVNSDWLCVTISFTVALSKYVHKR